MFKRKKAKIKYQAIHQYYREEPIQNGYRLETKNILITESEDISEAKLALVKIAGVLKDEGRLLQEKISTDTDLIYAFNESTWLYVRKVIL